MRKGYFPVTVRYCSFESEGTILTGSMTETPITIKQVTVEDFIPGFQDAEGNDFATVTFD